MRTYLHLVVTASLSLAVLACGGSSRSSKQQAAAPTKAPEPAAMSPAPLPAPAPMQAGGPSCEQVADHVLEVAVTSDEYKHATPDQQQTVIERMPEFREDLVQQCSEQQWPADVKGCVMQAKAMADMETCEPVTR